MSWSVSIIGKPDAVIGELERESTRLSGQSKVEFDAAKPHLIGLVRENFKHPDANPHYLDPTLHLEASGSGSFDVAGTQLHRTCSAKVSWVNGKLVT